MSWWGIVALFKCISWCCLPVQRVRKTPHVNSIWSKHDLMWTQFIQPLSDNNNSDTHPTVLRNYVFQDFLGFLPLFFGFLPLFLGKFLIAGVSVS